MISEAQRFFETPIAVARRLAQLVLGSATSLHKLAIADICAGRGQLASAFIDAAPPSKVSSIRLLELSSSLLNEARKAVEADIHVELLLADVLEIDLDDFLSNVNVVLCNPPYCGFRQCSIEERQKLIRSGFPPYNELSCLFVLKILRSVKTGTLCAFTLRKDVIVGSGYTVFREMISNLGRVIHCEDIGRSLMPGSGKAKASIVIIRRCVTENTTGNGEQFSETCWTKVGQQDYQKVGFERLGENPWPMLGDICEVVAVPNTGDDKFFIMHPSSNHEVVRLPSSKTRRQLWGVNRTVPILWKPGEFSQRRNLRYQGMSGVVYRLAGGHFTTGILPESVFFLSATPAILPRRLQDLDWVTGVSLIPAWQRAVRLAVTSTNFTPGAVARCLIPPNKE